MPRAGVPRLTCGLLFIVAGSFSKLAFAGPPSAFTSYIEPHVVSCPAGDSIFVVYARDPSDNAWARCCVNLHVCSCAGFHLSTAGHHPYAVDPTGCIVSVDLRDGTFSGIARFPLAAGGLCPGDSMLVDGDGVPLGFVRRVTSFDQTGDLRVGADDLAIIQSKIGTADPTADFDGDGQVTDADLAIAQGHLGHAAPDAVGVGPPSAGALRLSPPKPNPFSGETRFTLMLDESESVEVSVNDLAGRRVATLFRGFLEAGPREFSWKAVGGPGAPVHGGAYFLQVRAGNRRLTQRAILLSGR